jgi:signal transduction histidine kinase
MSSLLAVPVECRGPFKGNLYLSDRLDGSEFSENDVETLLRFATQVALAIDNQHLHGRLRELAVAEERARIARELHDGTAQVLSYVNVKAQAVREHLDSGRGAEAAAQLDQLARAAREVYADVRGGILTLRQAAAAERSLAERVRALVEEWRTEAGLGVELSLDGELALEPESEVQALRIVGEALANVRKHARAQRVVVGLSAVGEAVRLSIEDDGSGFEPGDLPPADLPRFGLQTMTERARLLGGSLRIESRRGGPTRVTAELPRRLGARSAGGKLS